MQTLLLVGGSYRNVPYNVNPFQTARKNRIVDSITRKSASAGNIEVWLWESINISKFDSCSEYESKAILLVNINLRVPVLEYLRVKEHRQVLELLRKRLFQIFQARLVRWMRQFCIFRVNQEDYIIFCAG